MSGLHALPGARRTAGGDRRRLRLIPARAIWHDSSMLCRSLIGREGELSQLRAAWSSARDGTGSCVIVRGVAGVGKSRLVRELEVWARAHGATVLRGRASAATDSPLRPVCEALLGVARRGFRPTG